jgi:phage shock protein PspC (stress-responsive transcriptional regulator)
MGPRNQGRPRWSWPPGAYTMEDMTETQDQPTGPRVTGEEMRDVTRLRRSKTDRYVAGVAGGLGRHFDIDPTVIRVVLAVLTLFGGAGLLVYVAVWLLVPEDGEDRAPLTVGSELQKVLLIAAAVVAVGIVFGTPFAHSGWAWGFPLPLLVLGLLGLWIYSLVRRDRTPAPPPAPWAASTPPPASPQEGTTMSTTDTLGDTAPVTGTPHGPTQEETQPYGQPPAWMPPPTPAYVPPPRPRRTGLVLFWPTLALIAIGEGILGIIDSSTSVPPSAYVALAVFVTAVMLLVGAFVGRPGGLIALGLLTSLALIISSAVEASTDWKTGGETVSYAPVTAAAVSDSYSVPNGEIKLDLRNVRDLAALNGRTIDLHLNAGDIQVELPRGVNAIVDAEMHVAGDVNIDGNEGSGFNPHLTRTLTGSANPAAPTLTLDLDARVGQIKVEQD